jgi:hypothetical protein
LEEEEPPMTATYFGLLVIAFFSWPVLHVVWDNRPGRRKSLAFDESVRRRLREVRREVRAGRR